MVNPESVKDHYYLLTDLEPRKKYQLRLTCRSADGRVGNLQTDYTYLDPEKVPFEIKGGR